MSQDGHNSIRALINSAPLAPEVKTELTEWVRQRILAGEKFSAVNVNVLLETIRARQNMYGAELVCEAIRESIEAGDAALKWAEAADQSAASIDYARLADAARRLGWRYAASRWQAKAREFNPPEEGSNG